MEGRFFFQSTSFQYCLLMLLGAFGIYLSMPIDLHPGSAVAWVDLIINLLIFVPCSLITAFSAVFAIICSLFSYDLDRKNRFKNSANWVLRGFGLSTSFVSDLVDRTKQRVTNGLTALGIPEALLADGPLRLLQKTVSYAFSRLFPSEEKTAPEPIQKSKALPASMLHAGDEDGPGSKRRIDET